MKKIKRIVAVTILLVFILLIGYFVNTCKSIETGKKQDYVGNEYYSSVSESYLYIINESTVYYSGIKMEIVGDSDNVLIIRSPRETEYKFVFLDNDKLFDISAKEVMFRVVCYG